LTLEEPTEENKRAFGLPHNVEGVVVTAVDPDSPAAVILQPGDIILEIGWEKVTRPVAAADKLAKLRNLNRGPVQVYIQRGDLLFYESLTP
jgi:serine protease Do